MTDRCAKCGHPRAEHSYNGACYGLCGEFVEAPRFEVHSAPVIKSFVGSTRDDRCLEVWFADKVTEETRAWLLAAINEKALAGAEKPGAPHDLPFHKETMNGLNSLTIRPESAPVAQESGDCGVAALDQAWDEINALGGSGNSTNLYDDGVVKTAERALDIIEKLGGMDPKLREAKT